MLFLKKVVEYKGVGIEKTIYKINKPYGIYREIYTTRVIARTYDDTIEPIKMFDKEIIFNEKIEDVGDIDKVTDDMLFEYLDEHFNEYFKKRRV